MAADPVALIAERHRAALLAALHAPRLTRAELIAATGAPPAALAGWINRRQLRLDADVNREAGAHRRFSALDAARVAVAAELAALGLTAGTAIAAAEAVADCLANHAYLATTAARPLFDPRAPLLIDTRGGGAPRVFAQDAAPQAVALVAVRPWPILSRAAEMIGEPLIARNVA